MCLDRFLFFLQFKPNRLTQYRAPRDSSNPNADLHTYIDLNSDPETYVHRTFTIQQMLVADGALFIRCLRRGLQMINQVCAGIQIDSTIRDNTVSDVSSHYFEDPKMIVT